MNTMFLRGLSRSRQCAYRRRTCALPCCGGRPSSRLFPRCGLTKTHLRPEFWGGNSRRNSADSRGLDSVWLIVTNQQGAMVFDARHGPGGTSFGFARRRSNVLSNTNETLFLSNSKLAVFPWPPRYKAPVVRPVP